MPWDVKAAAHHVLDSLVASLPTLGRTVPTHRYVTVGQEVFDFCPQLTVSVLASGQGIPGAPALGPYTQGTPFQATLRAALVSCWPSVAADAKDPIPWVTTTQAAADGVLDDLAALLRSAAALPDVGCGRLAITDSGVLGPSGQAAAAFVTLSLSL